MKQHLTATKLVLALGILATSICILSFRGEDSVRQKTFRKEITPGYEDTPTPRKRNRNTDEFRDLDETMKGLDIQMKKLDEQMKKLDFSKMEKDINSAIAKIDAEKISKEIEASMAKIDWKKMELEMKQAMEEVKNIDKVKIKAEMEKVKADLAKQKFDIKIDAEKINKDVKEAMENAKASIGKAKAEIKQMKEFTDELQKDGLIDKSKAYKIQVKDNELYINDKKQPKEVNDKYRKYFKKDNYTIQSDGKDD
jgi:hypothetical protein